MKNSTIASLAMILLTAFCSIASAQEGPYVYKTSVRINTRKFLVYYPTPTAKEPQYSTNTWAPRFEFNVQGPLEGGSQISVSFKKPDGAAWFSSNLDTPEKPADEFAHFSSDALDLEKKAITTIGSATMTVTLTNALSKTNKTLFTGKFDVGKFYYGPTAAAKPKDAVEYYVNHDWNLPIGQLAFDSAINAEAPHLRLLMWFRGPVKAEDLAGYLYYKGKQISTTKTNGGVYEMIKIETGITQPDTRWGRSTISFDNVSSGRVGNSANNYPDMHWLDKNPGAYEVKILRDGKLARTASFTIGEDGKLIDNGLAAKNNMGLKVMLIPIKVEPGLDPKADITKYKEQAYYGNPIVGFP